ncbi:MAG: hypothetical protein ACK5MI_04125 [Mangrovibacterium sp.]
MELGTNITGLILLLLCILPIVLSIRSRNKIKQQFLAELTGYANQYNCTIHQYEITASYIIGIDKEKKHLFFESKIDEQQHQQMIDLNGIKECAFIRKSKNIKGYGVVIERLALGFIPKKLNNQRVEFELYNADLSAQLSGELQSLESWYELINEQLKNKS